MKKTKKEYTQIIEGILFASHDPLTAESIIKQYFQDEDKPALGMVRQIIDELKTHFEERGIQLAEVASGFRFQVNQAVAPYIAKKLDEKPARYSRALLETLALIAYRQPITRGEIEDIRGVAVNSHIVKTLEEHEWIRVVGHKDVPGKPALLATTKQFLDHFGLKSLEELPPLSELKDFDMLEPLATSHLMVEETPQETQGEEQQKEHQVEYEVEYEEACNEVVV